MHCTQLRKTNDKIVIFGINKISLWHDGSVCILSGQNVVTVNCQ